MNQPFDGEVLAIVGSTYDITGIATSEAQFYDSNPSRIYSGCGGAGRNIGENMARMGLRVGIISAYGTDAFSKELLEANTRAGMDVSRCYIEEGSTSCMYISLLDQHGELLLAAADLELQEAMPPGYIDANAEYINGFPIVFVDTNNTEETLRHIASVAKGRIFADTVSISKSIRLRPILNRLDTVKTNRGELEMLSGIPIKNTEDIIQAAETLIEKGVSRVFVTMGTEGSCYVDANGFSFMQSFPVNVKNVTGAGDAYAAAVTYGTLRGFTNEEILLLGTSASLITLESKFAVNPKMCEPRLLTVYKDFMETLEAQK